MKQIKLERLTARNFKGFRDFALVADGGNVDAFGDNGTGKTTIFDAFMWGLFGKDSTNRTDFEIKELDEAGNVRQHGLDHEVEVVLSLDGRRKVFRRVFAEKWTKKRGSALSEFTGHTTSYFVDGVPVKQGEYTAAVDTVIKEDVFKLLTNPQFFNEQLKWEQRRRILLEVCGDITDEEVIFSNKALEKLPSILNDRSIEDHRKVIAARRADINKELEKIPVRIDEARRSAPNISELDEELLLEDIQTVRGRITAKEDEMSRIQSGGEISVKEKRLREIETDMIGIKNELQQETLGRLSRKREEVDLLHREVDQIRRHIDDAQHHIETNRRRAQGREEDAKRLREKWSEVSSQQLIDHHHNDNCPTCGQSLPEDQVQAARDKELTDFNVAKARRLEQISTEGKAAAAEVKRLQDEVDRFTVAVEENHQALSAKQEALAAAEEELTALRASMQDPAADSRYQQLQSEAGSLRQEIENLRSSTVAAAGAVREQLAGLRKELESLEAEKAKIGQARTIEQRIIDLEKQEKTLASEYEQLEQELFLTEEFVRTKVSMLEKKINSKFKYARFKLFDQQINGGLKEVCVTTFRGVPYDGGLNNAAQSNVGLDIINTLSEHYGFLAPIFIDNAEAVTKLFDTASQVIRLIVPPAFDSLPVETKKELIKLHGSYEKASDVWKEKNKQLRIETQGNQIQEAI